MAAFSFQQTDRAFADNKKIKDLHVRLSFKMPLDPLEIVTMADYDLSLLLARNWFGFDESRKPTPSIIKSWQFDDAKGLYLMVIDPSAKWSNGKQITSDELVWNIKRAIKRKTTYGKAIAGLVEIDKIVVSDELRFSIPIKNKKPSEAFFQRMASIFNAVVNPSDCDKSGAIKSNSVSAGPFMISNLTSDEIVLVPNPFFQGLSKQIPQKIVVRSPDPAFDLAGFVDEKTWENIVQTTTMVPDNIVSKIKGNKIPFWTRGHDRVSLMKPFAGNDLEDRSNFLKLVFAELEKDPAKSLPLNVSSAKSLQPLGYPLFEKLTPADNSTIKIRKSEFLILAADSPAVQAQRPILEKTAAKLKISLKWDLQPKKSVMALIKHSPKHDFILFDFGVADPEPVTWIGLIFENSFIHVTPGDHEDFKRISSLGASREVEPLKELLKRIFIRGGYLPLFHFSTLSLGHKGLDFSQIRELDETVDYSKVIVK